MLRAGREARPRLAPGEARGAPRERGRSLQSQTPGRLAAQRARRQPADTSKRVFSTKRKRRGRAPLAVPRLPAPDGGEGSGTRRTCAG